MSESLTDSTSKSERGDNFPALLSLFRYWIYSDRARESFFETARDPTIKKLIDENKRLGALCFWLTAPGVFMAFWYGALFVVIEGYRDLKKADPEIDNLLSSPNVEYLRLFRNATFHYQKSPFPEKHIALMQSEDSIVWIRQLHRRLGNFIYHALLSEMPPERRIDLESAIENFSDQFTVAVVEDREWTNQIR